MRRVLSFCAAAALCCLPLGACLPESDTEAPRTIRIGVTVYDQYDTFIKELMDSFVGRAQAREQATGVAITIMRESAAGSQETQNNQVESFIEAGCDVLCVNLVDRMDASVIIDKAEAAGLPIVFFNRELVEENLQRSDRLYYVGADALESGRMQGEIAAMLCRERGEQIDKNGDEVYQYVMLEGEAGHQDAVVRTEYTVKAATAAGLRLERLEDEIANWVRAQAETKMTQWLEVHGDAIEIVFANNDDMALGAIDALKRAGIPSGDWPVILGIDGTKAGLEAVMLGKMSGTVLNDSDGQAKGLLELSCALATREQLPPLQGGKYIRLPYKIITPGNISEFYQGGFPL